MAHGALDLNEFDTYALSDFEGHEDSFPWEGWEIWDIYAGDGFSMVNGSHAVYFKGNFAGDGTARPTGGQEWSLEFTFDVAGTTYTRSITHDGSDVATDFEQLEFQIADGNVFQVHAWVPIPDWEGESISNLVVRSLVDGSPRDVAPGGFYDPALGQEVPFQAPATPVFPAMGEGRIVDAVHLTGAAKFLEVEIAGDAGTYAFTATNPLANQGQHFLVQIPDLGNWSLDGRPNAESLDGGQATNFTMTVTPNPEGLIEPLRIDLATDIGGLQSWYAYVAETGVELTQNQELATATLLDAPIQEESPGVSGVLLFGLIGGLAVLLRRR